MDYGGVFPVAMETASPPPTGHKHPIELFFSYRKHQEQVASRLAVDTDVSNAVLCA